MSASLERPLARRKIGRKRPGRQLAARRARAALGLALAMAAGLASACWGWGIVAPGASLTSCLAECRGNRTCELDCRTEYGPDDEGPLEVLP